ncbi:MAG: radical SAM protein [Thermoanaerobaculales bacterium]|nr:radical SAM protein [Thermoanaerobaculales bacterium]
MLKETDYAEFSKRIHGRVSPTSRRPINGAIEVTRRCNLSCSHCYNNLPAGDPKARARELTFEEYRRIFDQLAEAGTLWVLLTGGEIFARADFLDIYRYAKQKGFLLTLFTNGMAINEARADFLAQWRPFAIEITLYGDTRETYERLTGVPGSFDRVRRAIEIVLERQLPLKLKTVVLKENRHELGAMKEFAEELGVEFKFDAMINPRLDGSLAPLATRLEPAEVVALDLEDPRRLEAWDTFCDHFHGPAQPPEREDRLYHCGGAVNSFSIDPYGNLGLCGFSQKDLFDLRGGSFKEGWDSFLGKVVERRVRTVTKCTTCHLKALCGMCPAYGELENGNPENPVDHLCHVAHLRAHMLELEISPHGECEYCPGGREYELLLSELCRLEACAVLASEDDKPLRTTI